MGFLSVLSCAHQWISSRLQPGELAIDATVGTGADTLFLAQKVGKRGQVIGFDIQSEALTLAQGRIRKQEDSTQLGSISLLQLSHDRMAEAVPDTWQGNVGAVIFNLGYLPSEGADSTIITKTDSTIAALQSALELLRPRGIITVVLYPGHDGGSEEADAVMEWSSALPVEQAQVVIYRQLQRKASPFLIGIEKK
ncbi:16S rRNA (cytosine(1402)-N(4))-methyltransferase [Chryseobacterium mucoviscidosis]|uniref:class I SAM-dependent methyltransferase n=1 Tax=unclassified Paenibacillus TaxID=185978 RepID=UPI0009A289DF|nr:class I SAM-dependent methyltransferase [Paenibacillus sp. 11B]MDN8592530.1 class I SAM-dependent methyltransferase [Paenibacillus sp. 11B]OPG98686.1 16S rRNA (cytosine(1402)-N(4))-methyltransferase [Chryseobacterium mucoviscidosis]